LRVHREIREFGEDAEVDSQGDQGDHGESVLVHMEIAEIKGLDSLVHREITEVREVALSCAWLWAGQVPVRSGVL
jgi:hypothetical protein